MSDRKNMIKKKKQVEELSSLIKKNKYVTVINLRSLSDNILQSMKKKLRGKAVFRVYKVAVISRAFKATKFPDKILNLSEKEPLGVILSNELSPYQINQFFRQNEVNVYAKPGQLTEVDIKVKKMETNIPPGPALTELKQAGLKAAVQKGKIAILSDAVLTKAGEKISPTVAKVLQKLEVRPFTARVFPLCGIDDEGIVFSKEILDLDASIFAGGLGSGFDQAIALSYNTNIPIKATADLIVSKANNQALALAVNRSILFESYAELILSNAFGQAMSIKKYKNI